MWITLAFFYSCVFWTFSLNSYEIFNTNFLKKVLEFIYWVCPTHLKPSKIAYKIRPHQIVVPKSILRYSEGQTLWLWHLHVFSDCIIVIDVMFLLVYCCTFFYVFASYALVCDFPRSISLFCCSLFMWLCWLNPRIENRHEKSNC